MRPAVTRTCAGVGLPVDSGAQESQGDEEVRADPRNKHDDGDGQNVKIDDDRVDR